MVAKLRQMLPQMLTISPVTHAERNKVDTRILLTSQTHQANIHELSRNGFILNIHAFFRGINTRYSFIQFDLLVGKRLSLYHFGIKPENAQKRSLLPHTTNWKVLAAIPWAHNYRVPLEFKEHHWSKVKGHKVEVPGPVHLPTGSPRTRKWRLQYFGCRRCQRKRSKPLVQGQWSHGAKICQCTPNPQRHSTSQTWRLTSMPQEFQSQDHRSKV